MDTHTLWLLALSLATPIAGVAGFAIQLRQVRKTRLENEKLLLEIEALKRKAFDAEQRVQRVTTEEVLKYTRLPGDVMFSRSTDDRAVHSPKSRWAVAKEQVVGVLLLQLVVLVVVNVVFDAYRVVLWLIAKL